MFFKRLSIACLAFWLMALTAPVARAEGLTHIVQPGETLYRIGLLYGVPWTDIASANNLNDTTIYPGQTLTIPGQAAPATANDVSAPTPTPAADSAYIVQRGDSLSAIARRYGVSLNDLIALNAIRNPALIYAGQRLLLPGAAPAPTAPPASTGAHKSILIDISEQHLYAYEGETLVFSFVASTGLPGLDTRPGTYNVLIKIPNAYGATWDIWMPNWLGIYWAGSLQNGIHALPILPDGSRLWAGYLGTPVSYGCIILGIEEAQQLYDWAEEGTAVVIQN